MAKNDGFPQDPWPLSSNWNPKDQFDAIKKLDFSTIPSNKNGLSHNKVLRIG